MKNKAKLKGQGRHAINTVSGAIVGMGIANAEEVAALRGLFEAVGIGPDLQIFIGLAFLLGAHLWSWHDKAKNIGEGDQPASGPEVGTTTTVTTTTKDPAPTEAPTPKEKPQ